jgi:predicted nucleotidyltransferase
MKTLNEIRQVLSLQKQSICEIYRITEIGIFGSYARGDETETSDIDILVDYQTAPTLIMLVDLKDYLSQLFGIKVDIVTKNGLKPRIRERVLAEVVYI